MKHIFYKVILVLIVFAFASNLMVIILMVYPYDILDIPAIANIVSTTIKKGELLQYIGFMDKKVNIPSKQECYFQDGIRYNLPSRWTNRPIGLYKENVLIDIPKTLPTGTTYTYCCDITYQPNPFQSKSYSWCTIDFNYIE